MRAMTAWGRTVQPDHLAAIEQRTMNGHEQAVHVEDRQRVDQHVATGRQALRLRQPQ
jgi:hypothetical protein